MLLVWILLLSVAAAVVICAVTDLFLVMSWLWMLPIYTLMVFLLLAALVFGGLMILCKRVDQDVPQDGDDPLYRKTADLIIESVLPLLKFRVKKIGMEKLPAEGRFMLICNHCSLADPILLLYAMPEYQLAFISKKENADMFVIGPMMHKLQCQLIDRENDREALKTILRCIQILKEDKASIGVFPEGGILSNDGKLHHFRPGVFKIAQKANVPIVVCTMKNTLHSVSNLLHLKPTHVELSVLEVIPPEELKGVTTVDIANRCYQLMAADLGPDLIAQ